MVSLYKSLKKAGSLGLRYTLNRVNPKLLIWGPGLRGLKFCSKEAQDDESRLGAGFGCRGSSRVRIIVL